LPFARATGSEWKKIKDISLLSDFKELRYLKLYATSVTDLRPLMKLENLRDLSVNAPVLAAAVAEYGFVPPREPPRQPPDRVAEEISQKLKARDWAFFYQTTPSESLRSVLFRVFHDSLDPESIEALLNHPDERVFRQVVIQGLDSHYSSVARAFEAALVKRSDRIKEALLEGYKYHLDLPWYDEFHIGKFKTAHFMIARVLDVIAAPEFTELFLLFLNERKDFSELHLRMYKILLNSASKTKSHDLVEPVIDLLRYENQIIDRDNVFIKKCLKVIGALGSKPDIELVRKAFPIAGETRADVIQEYDKMAVRLEKKKPK
jgi:hypothetical protein